ncbi:unnamed protein product [Prunus armeniaca]
MSEEAPFRPREKLLEKQKFFQSVHKYTYLKGPYDKITSVAIPAALAASSLFLINCRSFLNLLDGYCTASGQQVNYSKSFIYLSPNASPELEAEIGVALRINPTTDPGVYLGIPANRGISKKEA